MVTFGKGRGWSDGSTELWRTDKGRGGVSNGQLDEATDQQQCDSLIQQTCSECRSSEE